MVILIVLWFTGLVFATLLAFREQPLYALLSSACLLAMAIIAFLIFVVGIV